MDEGYGWTAYAGPAEREVPPEGSTTYTVGAVPTADTDGRLRLSDLGKLARRGQRGLVGAARAHDRPTFDRLLHDHLGPTTDELQVTEEAWPSYDMVNVQLGLDAWLAEPGRTHELVGITGHRHEQFGLAELLQPPEHPWGIRPGAVARMSLPSGPDGEVTRAVAAGLYLVRDGDARFALLLLAASDEYGRGSVQLHAVGDVPGAAGEAASEVRRLALVHNVYRGRLVSFDGDMFGERGAALSFQPRPHVTDDEVILPRASLDVLRRQVLGVAVHRERLLAARQHLKRGLLLYGPPGVGKTHTVRHLVSELDGVTVVQLTGGSLSMISTACSVARSLQPSMIVVEDVDLIAEDRGMHPGQHPLLFELLNQMDGLSEDADVVFLLTTNRADLLEPALAARPGRVDQAVELRLPDAGERARLFELYRGGLEVDTSRLETVLERTEGVTASFLKELLRRAALVAAEATPGDTAPLRVAADQLDAALEELLDTRNAMTRAVLGGGERVTSPPYDEDEWDDEP
ncbi:AAA family ATPase [Nocardioides aurantiacus]|uniref:AAA family ATPase n=1 Tax=Nocardioides aurantiacus TaxID=86796 RepID=UPI00403FA1A0